MSASLEYQKNREGGKMPYCYVNAALQRRAKGIARRAARRLAKGLPVKKVKAHRAGLDASFVSGGTCSGK